MIPVPPPNTIAPNECFTIPLLLKCFDNVSAEYLIIVPTMNANEAPKNKCADRINSLWRAAASICAEAAEKHSAVSVAEIIEPALVIWVVSFPNSLNILSKETMHIGNSATMINI